MVLRLFCLLLLWLNLLVDWLMLWKLKCIVVMLRLCSVCVVIVIILLCMLLFLVDSGW